VSALHDYGSDAGGNPIDRGFYAVDPRGGLFVLPPSAPLKAGWRLATEDDLHPAPSVEPPRIGPALVAFDESSDIEPAAVVVLEDDAIED
jgi:hypothetical protein